MNTNWHSTKDIHEKIVDYFIEYKLMPTCREIGKMMGIGSTSTVHKYMQLLVEKGYLVAYKKGSEYKYAPTGVKVVREGK